MTLVMTRPPLQTLDMASAQRATRRRTVYQAFDEENEAAQPTAKKAKVETGKQVNGRVNAEASKKAKQSYDEDDDGFQFSRSRPKKPQTKTAPPPPEPQPVPVEAKASTPPKRRRKKYSFSESDKKENEVPRKTRRSTRLSGEKAAPDAPVQEPARAEKVEAPAPEPQRQDEDVAPVVNRVVEPAKRRTPKKIALPFADTPIIRRNKEMRKRNSGEGHRRSSTGIRGRRASSLIDSGTSNAVPHADVETADFYRHIEQSLPEPRRMKQLLTWCGARALPAKQHGDGRDGGASLAARHIEEEILKDIANRPDLYDWFDREDLTPAVLVKKPNPRNIQMAARVQELEEEIKRLQDEQDAWEALLKSSSAPSIPEPATSTSQDSQAVPPDGERRPKLRQPPVEPLIPSETLDLTLLDPSQAAIYASLTHSTLHDPSMPNPESAAAISTRISSLAAKLEPVVDLFADGVHKASQYRIAAERVADRILASSSQSLEKRSRDAQAQAAAERGVEGGVVQDVKNVLGALASVLNGQ